MPFIPGAWQEETQGTLLLCRTAETANRMCQMYPHFDAVKADSAEPRAYNAVWLCDKLSRRGPYRRVVLCDGMICPQEAAQVKALYPEAEIYAAPKTEAIKACLRMLRCTVDELRSAYRALRSGQTIDLSVPHENAVAHILASMELIALTPAPQLLPMQKKSPEDDPLYQLILMEGDA